LPDVAVLTFVSCREALLRKHFCECQKQMDTSVPIPKVRSLLRSHVSNFGIERTLANLSI